MEIDPKKLARRVALFWLDLARARWTRWRSPELDGQIRTVVGRAAPSRLLLVLLVVTGTSAVVANRTWPDVPRLLLSSPALVFAALLGLWLRVWLRRIREHGAIALAVAFDALLGLVMFHLLVASVLATVMRWNGLRGEGLTEWVQGFFLFDLTDELVLGPVESVTWTLMWACVVCAQLATRSDPLKAVREVVGYSISLAMTFFLVKLIVVDLAVSRMAFEFLIDSLPLPEIILNDEWLRSIEWLFFRSVMVLLELSIAASVWTAARERFAGGDGLEGDVAELLDELEVD